MTRQLRWHHALLRQGYRVFRRTFAPGHTFVFYRKARRVLLVHTRLEGNVEVGCDVYAPLDAAAVTHQPGA